jgi:hypothetical protein
VRPRRAELLVALLGAALGAGLILGFFTGGDDEDEDAPKKKKKKKVVKPKKAPAPKRARSAKKVVRQMAVWVIYDNSSKQIETFPYNQRDEAEKFLASKAEDPKKGYYLQMVKVPLDEK